LVAAMAENLSLTGFTDWHCHLLPGLDDGPATVDEALTIGRILAAQGFARVFCTPHMIRGTYDNSPSGVRDAVLSLQEALDSAGIPLGLHTGLEYYMDEYLLSFLADPLTLDGSRCILVEAPVNVRHDYLKEMLFQMVRRDYTPLLAHPERSEAFDPQRGRERKGLFHHVMDMGGRLTGTARSGQKWSVSTMSDTGNLFLNTLRDMGCLFQGNIGSFAGIYGDKVRKRAVALLEAGIYYCLGSDSHHHGHLDAWLARGLKEIERIAGKEVTERLLGRSV
jgi:protein-tyrosine phosphatase